MKNEERNSKYIKTNPQLVNGAGTSLRSYIIVIKEIMPETIQPQDDSSDEAPEGEEVRAPEHESTPERHIVESFAELIIRGQDAKTIRIWDMGTEEGYNESIEKKFLKAMSEPGSYIDAKIYQARSYQLTFNAYGPDLNAPGGNDIAFWGGCINSDNFDVEWADKVDLGPNNSGRSANDYEELLKEMGSRR